MAVAGIICEYNPFHLGHAWQIAELRRQLGEDTGVVCAMSGNFVQRGDFAVMEKHARAEAAIRGGADLVLELPVTGALSSAEGFAAAGVAVLAQTGVVDTLVFGSECADSARLMKNAECLLSAAFVKELSLTSGESFAACREAAVERLLGAETALSSPNDILGVEYCKAILKSGAALTPLALRRNGAMHDGEASDGIASATGIRELLKEGEDASRYMGETSAAVYARECKQGRAPVFMENAERAILSALRGMAEEDFRPYDGGSEGLYHRFYAAVRKGGSIEEILAEAKTKRYALSRLRRMLLCAYLGVGAEESVPYLRVLAANEKGRALLKRMKKTASAPILTKSADVKKLSVEAQRLFETEVRATDRYVLSYPSLSQSKPGSEWTNDPVIL